MGFWLLYATIGYACSRKVVEAHGTFNRSVGFNKLSRTIFNTRPSGCFGERPAVPVICLLPDNVQAAHCPHVCSIAHLAAPHSDVSYWALFEGGLSMDRDFAESQSPTDMFRYAAQQ